MNSKLIRNLCVNASLRTLIIAVAAQTGLAKKITKKITVTVINNSGKNMTAIYMSPPDKNTWGENEIPGTPVPDRKQVDFEWNTQDYEGTDGGCIFDVRAEYSDGKYTELDKVNLCITPSLNFN